MDRAGRKALRIWAEEKGHFLSDERVHYDDFFAYLDHVSGVLAHDLNDENVVRIPETESLAVIDPYISLARQGTLAALKLAEIGFPIPPDDPFHYGSLISAN